MSLSLEKTKTGLRNQTNQHMKTNSGHSLKKNVGRLPKFGDKEAAMSAIKEARSVYLALARKAAHQLAMKSATGSITIDDVRATCPPPGNVDPRLMGAVFLEKGVWEPLGFENSKRSTCHRRPIQRFRLVSF